MYLCEKLLIEVKKQRLSTEEGWQKFVNKLLRDARKDLSHEQLGVALEKCKGIDAHFYENSCFDLFAEEIKGVIFH